MFCCAGKIEPTMGPPRKLLSAPPSVGSNVTHGSSGNAAATGNNSSQWGPFGNASTYGTDMALALGILISGFVLGVLLMLGVRFYLRRRRAARVERLGDPDRKPDPQGRSVREERPSEPPTLYSAGKTELAGAAVECAICLTEFVEGDALRVLPACRHGFHIECVERWLASSSASTRPPARRAAAPSCPVCRASCLPPEITPEPEPEPEPS